MEYKSNFTKINDNLMTEVSNTVKQMSKLEIDKPTMPEVKNITLQQQNSNLREYLVGLQKIIAYLRNRVNY